MGLMFWQRPVGQELSGTVKKGLISEFALEPGIVDKMRYSGKNGHYSNRSVKYIRVYDPVLMGNGAGNGAGNGTAAAPGYDALDLKGSRRSALLFEGRIEKIDDKMQVFLTDRRAR